MATYAGRYSEDLQDRYGNGFRNAVVAIEGLDSSPATLYADRDKTAYAPASGLAANEIKSDSRGNLTFFADPDNYQIVVTPSGGSTLAAYPVTVYPDPLEPTASTAALDAEEAARIAADDVLSDRIDPLEAEQGGSRPPSGGAGGALSGTYPNPGFAVDMATQAELDSHTSLTNNPHATSKAHVGLGNVDNTSDANKPVSTAQATADGLRVLKAGDTLTGNLVGIAPTLDTHLTTQGRSRQFVRSRGQNLVTNGSGALLDNTGFPAATFDPVRLSAGYGSFRHTTHIFGDEYIAVDPSQMYLLSLQAKADSSVANSLYLGLVPYDIDGLSITPVNWRFVSASQTTLSADLNSGDTVVNLTSTSGWSAGASSNLGVWPCVSLGGLAYPSIPANYAYTRKTSSLLGGGTISAVGASTITLSAQWTGGNVPAGTTVSQMTQGGTYLYVAAAGSTANTAWTSYAGHIGRVTTAGAASTASWFPPGCALVKLVLLINLGGGSTPHNLGAIRFGLHPRALQSPDGTWRQLLVDNAGVLSAPALA